MALLYCLGTRASFGLPLTEPSFLWRLAFASGSRRKTQLRALKYYLPVSGDYSINVRKPLKKSLKMLRMSL